MADRHKKKQRKLTKATKRIQDSTAQTMTINKFQVLANINNETKNEESSINQRNNDQPKDPK
jgi:hypothetical protein